MGSELELRLFPEPVAPMLARAAISAMGSAMPEALALEAELLTTELVSNAVRHANLDPTQEIILRVRVDESVRVEVVDPGLPFRAVVPPISPTPGSGGWGLFLIEEVATSWGVEPEGVGKKVWFELAAADRGAKRP